MSITKPALVAGLSAAGLMTAGPTFAQVAEVELSGQINAAVVFGGDINDPEIVDNTASGSRIRLKNKVGLDNVTFTSRYEIQFQENSSFGAVDGGESIDTRYAEVGVRGGFGEVLIGKGDGASNGTAEASFLVSGNLFGGGHLPLFTVASTLNRDNPNTAVGFTYYDGFSRNSRIRYNTPDFGGFTAAVSFASGDRQELGLRFKREIGPGKVTLQYGVANSSDGNNDRMMLSGGYKFDFGFSFAASVNSRTQGGGADDLESLLLSANYQFGKTTLSVDIGESGLDGENEVQQIGFIYKPVKYIDLYGGYVNYDNADNTSLASAFAGARYKY